MKMNQTCREARLYVSNIAKTIVVILISITYVELSAQTSDTSTVLGTVFSVNGNNLELMHGGNQIRIGETLYILQDGKPLGKLQVTQTFHTKVNAKVLNTSVTIVKGMSFGRWKEWKKEVVTKPVEPTPKPTTGSGKWSAYQGAMNWHDAKKKCASLGMRLPTRDELVAAHKAGVWEQWKADTTGSWYWTSEESSAEYAYNVDMDNGYVGDFNKVYIDVNVRCVR